MADHSPLPPPGIDALVAAIRDGHLDDDLPAFVDAINERRQRSERDLTRRALQHLSVGTRVCLDEHIRPKYLQRATGTIHQIDGTTVVVSLDTPPAASPTVTSAAHPASCTPSPNKRPECLHARMMHAP